MNKEKLPHLVLIFEDDIDLVQQWTRAFKEKNIFIHHASNIQSVEELCKLHQYDAVVCDIFIKDKYDKLIPEGGIKLLNYLRTPILAALPDWCSSVPKIAVTGASSVNGFNVVALVKDMGCNTVMQKPFEPDELVDKVLEYLLD